MTSLSPSASETLSRWTPTTGDERALHAEYLAFAADSDHTHRETSVAEHLTASSFVFSRDLDRVLLCHHRKGQFWVQLGGHIERDDDSLLDAALREAGEESGLERIEPLLPTPVDLNRHALSTRFGTCRVHWDIGFAFTADAAETPTTSDESEDVRWWPIDALPADGVDGLADRIARALREVRDRGADGMTVGPAGIEPTTSTV